MFKTILGITLGISVGIAICGIVGGILGYTASIAADKYQEHKDKKLLEQKKNIS